LRRDQREGFIYDDFIIQLSYLNSGWWNWPWLIIENVVLVVLFEGVCLAPRAVVELCWLAAVLATLRETGWPLLDDFSLSFLLPLEVDGVSTFCFAGTGILPCLAA